MKSILYGAINVLLVLLILSNVAFGESKTVSNNEGILAFEYLDYSVLAGKSIMIKPVAQNIGAKLTYSWSSQDSEIAIVNKNGTVLGIKAGSTLIQCVGENKKSESTFTASYTIHVLEPVKKIIFTQDSIRTYGYSRFNIDYNVEPADASNQQIEWEIANKNIISHVSGNTFLACGYGETRITAKATDGSGVKASIKVSVPKLYTSEDAITFTEPKSAYVSFVWPSINGISFMGYNYNEKIIDVNEVGAIEGEQNNNDTMFSDMNYLKITPKQAGSTTINFMRNGSSIGRIKIVVNHSAVFDRVSYPPIQPVKVLADEGKSLGTNITVNAKCVEKEKDGRYLLSTTVNKQMYVLRMTPVNTYTVGQEYELHGSITGFEDFVSETGLRYRVIVFEERAMDQKNEKVKAAAEEERNAFSAQEDQALYNREALRTVFPVGGITFHHLAWGTSIEEVLNSDIKDYITVQDIADKDSCLILKLTKPRMRFGETDIDKIVMYFTYEVQNETILKSNEMSMLYWIRCSFSGEDNDLAKDNIIMQLESEYGDADRSGKDSSVWYDENETSVTVRQIRNGDVEVTYVWKEGQDMRKEADELINTGE